MVRVEEELKHLREDSDKRFEEAREDSNKRFAGLKWNVNLVFIVLAVLISVYQFLRP